MHDARFLFKGLSCWLTVLFRSWVAGWGTLDPTNSLPPSALVLIPRHPLPYDLRLDTQGALQFIFSPTSYFYSTSQRQTLYFSLLFFWRLWKIKFSVSELLLPKLNQLFKILNLLENTPSQSWQHTRFFWDHEKLEKLACGWSAAQKGEKGFRQAEKKNVHSIFFGATTDGFTTNWRRLLGKYRLKTGSWWSVCLDRRCVEQQVRRDCLMVRVQVSHAQPETNHWQTEGDKHTTSNKGKSTKLCRS